MGGTCRPLATDQLAHSVSLNTGQFAKTLKWLRLLLSVRAGGGGAASSVAGGQDPVQCRRGVTGGWYQVTVSLLPPLQPSLVSWIKWRARSAGDWARMSFDLLCNATCVNSCRICSDTHNVGRYNRSGYDSMYMIHPVSVPIWYWSDKRPFYNIHVYIYIYI